MFRVNKGGTGYKKCIPQNTQDYKVKLYRRAENKHNSWAPNVMFNSICDRIINLVVCKILHLQICFLPAYETLVKVFNQTIKNPKHFCTV